MVYEGTDIPFTQEDFERIVPLSPKSYREAHDKDLNEVRVAAGLPIKAFYQQDEDIKAIQSAAGIL
jgi:hypothetical protein